jgi:hypothetical protein
MIGNEKVKRFFIAGLSAAFVNFLALAFFVEVLEWRTYLLEKCGQSNGYGDRRHLPFFLEQTLDVVGYFKEKRLRASNSGPVF